MSPHSLSDLWTEGGEIIGLGESEVCFMGREVKSVLGRTTNVGRPTLKLVIFIFGASPQLFLRRKEYEQLVAEQRPPRARVQSL